jgi:hypothetical protein
MGVEGWDVDRSSGCVNGMSTLESLGTKIAAVRTAADDPRGAYLIRSRLRRSILACTRAVADREGLAKPALAGQWFVPEDECARDVIALCRRIYDRSQELCQPSESFDVRWESGWTTLKDDLALLEAAVATLAQS